MDFEKAASYWEEKDKTSAKMDRETLLREAEAFLTAHNTCALATGAGRFVRCTPIEYTWHEGKLWMLSEGGQKFRALRENPSVCAAVYDAYEGFGKLGGLQLTGRAELVEPWSGEYCAFLAYKKLPEQALRGLDHPMYLIRVTPERIDLLNSEFKKRGVASRQQLSFGEE